MAKKDEIELLFRNNYKGMLSLAVRLLHNEEAARDIVHDIFASILAGKAEYATPSYLLTGVRLACLKHIRSLSTRERLNRLYAVDLQEIEDEEWPDDEDMVRINELVDNLLPEQTKRIVRLRFNSQMKYKEIADALSISEVAVYKHLRHAMNVLRQNLNNDER
ncbi:MAG: sigma-70 family RNA polymerase sigma factor [Muribaculaceae bacterium]|nr:sigma-70 family RNA polymerase sigma factor [Muribaculaceae bacterium]